MKLCVGICRVCVCRQRDSGSMCRVSKCLFREKERESMSITIEIESE